MPGKELGERDGSTTDRLIGELIAETRALKHETRQNSMKLDSIAPIAANAKEALKLATELKEEQARHHFRIAVLEADKNRREGAVGLVEWVVRHWPFTLMMALLAAWVAWANNRIHP